MPALYLLESIIKYHCDVYRDVFGENILCTFATVAEAMKDYVDPQARHALCYVRNSLNSFYAKNVGLNSIRIECHAICDKPIIYCGDYAHLNSSLRKTCE